MDSRRLKRVKLGYYKRFRDYFNFFSFNKAMVLEDHKRQGKKYIPPAKHLIQNLRDVSWKKHGLPELLWIGLMQDFYGMKKAVDIITDFTNICSNLINITPKPLIASTSSFFKLDNATKATVVTELKKKSLDKKIIEGIKGLLAFYPDCPLTFLDKPKQNSEELARLKKVVGELLDRHGKEATLTQATSVYLGLIQDKIKIATNKTPLNHFQDIEDYPNTEESRAVGSSVRALYSSVLGMMAEKESSHEWADYFWDRGMKIDRCEF